jgi:hypothetical protein
VYTVVFRHGRGEGGELNQREGEKGNTEEYRSQSWVENINMTECTLINTCRKVPLMVVQRKQLELYRKQLLRPKELKYVGVKRKQFLRDEIQAR